jgi:hypothetical protein
LRNLGTYLFAGIGLGIAMVITLILEKLKKRYHLIATITDAIIRKLFYNSVIRYAIQAYIQYCETTFNLFIDNG